MHLSEAGHRHPRSRSVPAFGRAGKTGLSGSVSISFAPPKNSDRDDDPDDNQYQSGDSNYEWDPGIAQQRTVLVHQLVAMLTLKDPAEEIVVVKDADLDDDPATPV